METFSALLAICAGNSPVTGEFHAQRPVTQSFDVFFDLCLNKRLSKQSWGWWFETPSRSLWRHCNERLLKASFNVPATTRTTTLTTFLVLCSWFYRMRYGAYFLNDVSIAIQIQWKFRFVLIEIPVNWSLIFCTFPDSYAVVACAKLCNDIMAQHGVTVKSTLSRI